MDSTRPTVRTLFESGEREEQRVRGEVEEQRVRGEEEQRSRVEEAVLVAVLPDGTRMTQAGEQSSS